MPPTQNGGKPTSRFANVLKFKPGSGVGPLDVAPPPPPKDSSPNPPPSAFYNKPFFSRSAASLSPSLSPESISGPATPPSPYPLMPPTGLEFGKRSNSTLGNGSGRTAAASPAPSASGTSLRSVSRRGRDYLPSPSMDGSTDSSAGSCPNTTFDPNVNRAIYQLNGASASSSAVGQADTPSAKRKKTVFKLANLARRNRSRKDISDTASASSASRTASLSEHEAAPGNAEGDEGISLPWNFQHHIHVDEGYIGLPPSWSATLSQVGFGDEEIAAIHARRRAVATFFASSTNLTNPHTTYSSERPASPLSSTVANTSSASSSTTLLDPVPRSTSLGKGRDALTIDPTSMYSVTTSTTAIIPAHSPRAPSFSMTSFVSGTKTSLTGDSASLKEDVAMGEEPEQFVFVSRDCPDEGVDQGMGNGTLIETFSFDSSSVSSLHTHTSRIQQLSQDEQTPRTPMFPQIQVYRAQSEAAYIPCSSPASRAPSPLSHTVSLPIRPPPRGYTNSPSSSPRSSPRPVPLSALPRTPPRRIYHVANPSSDSYEGEKYAEPPPAYVSPRKEEVTPRKEKEVFAASGGPPPPSRPIPPLPTEQIRGESPGMSNHDSIGKDQEVSVTQDSNCTVGTSVDDIPGTADEVLDISSYYGDNTVPGADAEMEAAQHAEVLSPIQPLVVDKRMSKLATLPPRLSFHQEGSLEDWSESLFSVIGKRSSVFMGRRSGSVASVEERRKTIRLISPSSTTGGTGSASVMASNSSLPSLPDISFGTDLALGSHTRPTIDAVEEGDEQERETRDKAEETGDTPEHDAGEHVDVDTAATAGGVEEVDDSPLVPSIPLLPDVSLGPNVSSLSKDLESPAATPSPPSESPRKASIDSLPPSPPPKSKPKPKPTPLALPATVALAPPRTNVITGISGRSPVNPLFGVKPQPLPIPIPPSQIRAQLRPAPPKPPHPPPTLPLPPLKRLPSQPNFQPPPAHSLSPLPSPRRALKHDSPVSHASPSDSRPNSSQTLHPVRANPGDRDSGLSTITVTPATIATAKTEVVRTAIASVVDSDAVSLASQRESVVVTADTVAHDEPDIGGESPRTQEAPDDSMVSETSSVSLLPDGPQSKWPTPPPPPVELEPDSTPRRISRFRTTSLGRVTQLQAMNGTISSPVNSHSSHGSSDTTSSSTSESAPLTTPKGVNGTSPSASSKPKCGLPPEARLLSSMTDTFGGVDTESETGEESETCSHPSETPSIPPTHPLLAQLQPYITPRDPMSCFTNLVEIAEGESGSVFAARVVPSSAESRSQEQQAGGERATPPGTSHVAIKRILLPPILSSPSLSDDSPVSNKLISVLHELCLLKNLDHEHLLLLDAVYICSNATRTEDNESANAVDMSLWIRMELMERSLADVIGLVAEGLALQERLVGRFASDVLHGLDYLQKQHIAHRDVRSDNLLVDATGVVKLADFSNAIRVDRNAPMVNGAVGVIYWQAPEMRAGPYNALKVDIWSLGATIWELAETIPPFSMPASPSTQVSFAIQAARHVGSQWPPLTHPEHYSRAFHEFLRLCGRESASRPSPGELLNTQFIRNACGRTVILQLLSQCRAIEEAMAEKEASTDQS